MFRGKLFLNTGSTIHAKHMGCVFTFAFDQKFLKDLEGELFDWHHL
jgi:hypothetical protein